MDLPLPNCADDLSEASPTSKVSPVEGIHPMRSSSSAAFYALELDTDFEYEGIRFSPSRGSPKKSPGKSQRYLPLTPIKTECVANIRRPKREQFSRGHEIPEPRPGRVLEGQFLRNGSLSSTGNSVCGLSRAESTGSFKSSALSPKRSISNSRHLYARPTTSLCLNYGKTLTTSFLSRKFPHPLNNIYHEKSTRLASSMHNAALPDGAESILEDSRFESIAAFSRREFYQNMPIEDRLLIAEMRANRGKNPPPTAQHFSPQQPGFAIDYERHGSPSARKRFICKQPFPRKIY